MQIRGGNMQKQAGFTIVEVLIVLAIASIMLIMAMNLISGKQARTEFQTSVRSTQAKLQTVMNEAASGYYPKQNLSCKVINEADYGNMPHYYPTPAPKGTDTECIYVGNLIVFGPSVGPQPHMDNFIVLPAAGNRFVYSTPIRNIRDAWPSVIAKEIAPWSSEFPDMSYAVKLPGGLKYVNGKLNGVIIDPTTRPFAIFATPLNSQKWLSTDPAQSSQQLSLRTIRNSDYDANWGDRSIAKWFNIESMKGVSEKPPVDPFPEVRDAQLCFASGGTNQSFIVAYKNASPEPATSIIEGSKTCGW